MRKFLIPAIIASASLSGSVLAGPVFCPNPGTDPGGGASGSTIVNGNGSGASTSANDAVVGNVGSPAVGVNAGIPIQVGVLSLGQQQAQPQQNVNGLGIGGGFAFISSGQ